MNKVQQLHQQATQQLFNSSSFAPKQPSQQQIGTPSYIPKFSNQSAVSVVQIHSRYGAPSNQGRGLQQPGLIIEKQVSQQQPPKTRNFTQVPSLKSSPMIQQQMAQNIPQKHIDLQEEDYIEDDINYVNADINPGERVDVEYCESSQDQIMLNSTPTQTIALNQVLNLSSPKLPLSSNELTNAFTARRQQAFQSRIPVIGNNVAPHPNEMNQSLNDELLLKTPYEMSQKPSMHARGQSMFNGGAFFRSQDQRGAAGMSAKISQQKGRTEYVVRNQNARIQHTCEDEYQPQYYQDDQEYMMTEEQDEMEDPQQRRKAYAKHQQDTPELIVMKDSRQPSSHENSEGNISHSSNEALGTKGAPEDASPQATPNSHSNGNFMNRFNQNSYSSKGVSASSQISKVNQVNDSHKRAQFNSQGNFHVQNFERSAKAFQIAQQSQQSHQNSQIKPQLMMHGPSQSTSQLRIPIQGAIQVVIPTMIQSTGQPRPFENKDCNETVEDENEGVLESRPTQEIKKCKNLKPPVYIENDAQEESKIAEKPTEQEDAETKILMQEYLELKQQLDRLKHASNSNIDHVKPTKTDKQASVQRIKQLGNQFRPNSQNVSERPVFKMGSNQLGGGLENGELTFSNEKLMQETRGVDGDLRRIELNQHDSKSPLIPTVQVSTQFSGKQQDKRLGSDEQIILVQKHSHTVQQSQRRAQSKTSHRNLSKGLSNESYDSSFEDFQKASTQFLKNGIPGGGLTESESEQKQLIVSNLKSVISRSNTTKNSANQTQVRRVVQKHHTGQNSFSSYGDEGEQSEEGISGEMNDLTKEVKRLEYSPDDEGESSGKRRSKYHRQGLRDKQKVEKVKLNKILKAQKDRKHLKININMNSITGAQQKGQDHPALQHQNDELIQRQIISQQQFLLAALAQQHQYAAALPSHNMLMQQQIAFQQQQKQMLMYQGSLLQPSGLTPSTLAGMPTGIPAFSDLTSQYSHSQSVSIPAIPESAQGDKIYIQRDFSSKNLNQHYQQQSGLLTQRVSQAAASQSAFNVGLSPSRRIGYQHINSVLQPSTEKRQLNNNFRLEPNQIKESSQLRHNPNVASASQFSQLIEDPQTRMMVAQQSAARNNPFSMGEYGRHANQHSQGMLNTYLAKGQQKKQVQSRNNRSIQQNYSSPIKQFLAGGNEEPSEGINANKTQYFNKGNYQVIDQKQNDLIGDDEFNDLTRRTMDVNYNHQGAGRRLDLIDLSEHRGALEPRKTGHFGMGGGQALVSNQKYDTQSSPISKQIRQHMYGETNSRVSCSPIKSDTNSIQEPNIQQHTYKHIKLNQIQEPNMPEKQPTRPSSSNGMISQSTRNEQPNGSEVTNDLDPQDKKAPQAILIGFEDVKQLKDPFKDKPVLKHREKEDKKTESKAIVGSQKQSLQQKRQIQKQTVEAQKPLRSPSLNSAIEIHLAPRRITQEVSPSKSSIISVSPSKRIPQSNNFQKVTTTPSQIQQKKPPATNGRPMTSKGQIESQIQKAQLGPQREQKVLNQASSALSGNQTPNMMQEETKAVKIDLQMILNRKPINQKLNSNEIKKQQEKYGADPIVIEDVDPLHNKDLVVEILEKKSAQVKVDTSLADMFLSRKKDIIEKLETRKAAVSSVTAPNHLYDQDGGELVPQIDDALSGVTKREKTKQELFEIRKAMMKKRPNKRQEESSEGKAAPHLGKSQTSSKVEPKVELMSRLATGQKPQVSSKEMKKLTKQNYHNLPEIKKKREEELKRQEHLARKAATQEYLKQLDETRKKKIAAKKRQADTQSLGEI
ncbi:hypothetical protein FGO68_gene17807 [Halteria grandinella]|uniref:ALMS motif domain-containing protein n=1 Tax=Halteria grandinella TaxID=5974 RepID=A0A8J8T9I2_HALGN|nr:hypothetical protein FGO68_gene17807 [Halteria grandinella]